MIGCFVGSGSDGMQRPEVVAKIIQLTRKVPADITVLYLGTATYDLPGPRHNQTFKLQEAGCKIIDIICGIDDELAMASKMDSADVILVSGGNTLFAVNFWTQLGLPALMKKAANRGCVLAGGSAGAICWFDGGHSDSADPDTYRAAMKTEVATASASAANASKQLPAKDESTVLKEGEEKKQWEYIRVPCLSFLPGLVCPHADRTQSNGLLRIADFDQMLLRHKGERGICIDHFAALVVDGDRFSVVSCAASGVGPEPAVYIKDVDENGNIVTRRAASEGLVAELLIAARDIVHDARCGPCSAANPIL
jgi:dipeptidase E